MTHPIRPLRPLLTGLGRNPEAPEDVLMRLAAHPDGRDGILRRTGVVPDAVVEAVLRRDPDAAVRLRGSRISPAMRRVIAGHPDPAVRDAFPRLIRSMVAQGVVLTSLEGMEEAYGRPRAELAADRDPAVRRAIAQLWRDRPLAVQRALLTDPEAKVRNTTVVFSPPGGIPADLVEPCLTDPATQCAAAGTVPLTEAWFARLVTRGDTHVRRAVARNPHLTPGMVARLADATDATHATDATDAHVRMAVARSRHTDAETRARLYALVEAEMDSGDGTARAAYHWDCGSTAWLRELPLDERLTYLECPHADFRRELASCADLPEAAWRRLDADRDVLVRRAAARRPDAPPEVLERLVREHGEASHLRPLIVEHPRFPTDRIRRLADAADPHARAVALADPELPPAVLERLAADPDDSVRAAAAGHPGAGPALLERLLSDPDDRAREEAAAHPALPSARMTGILDSADCAAR
ncbi:hypothetical protein [Streptomyces sp. NPDC048659]|uniref:hypothetical protein n=1 Tax=Streptomyces sp. NPDC048659 TaxID=3155489 RepID=UPI003435AC1E